MPLYVLDTHTALWALTADARLGNGARNVILDRTSALVFPAIAVAEALAIIQAGRSQANVADLWNLAFGVANVRFYPLDEAVLRATELLTAITEMHDRQIAATALVLQQDGEEAIVLTRDAIIVKSGLVETLW